MRRLGLGAIFTAAMTALVVAQPGASTLDKLSYLDPKTGRVVNVEGSLRESASGVVVTINGKERSRHPANEIVRIEYGDLTGLSPDDRAALFALENERDAEKQARGFAGLTKKATNERVKRGFEWREIQALAKAADSRDEAGFKSAAQSLAPRAVSFSKVMAKSWETVPAAKLAARLYGDLDEADRAAEVLTYASKTAELSPEQRAELKLAAADALLRGKSPAAGEAAVAALLKDKDVPATGPLRERLTMTDLRIRPDGLAKLPGAIDAARDPGARAAGFNARGELFLAAKKPREAMWEFLNVEVVYNQDVEETAKAVRRLIQLFEQFGERDRADQYREKLRKLR